VAGGVLIAAVNALIARRTAQAGANPLVTSSWQLTSASLVAALLLLIMPAGGGHAFDASIRPIGALLYLGLVGQPECSSFPITHCVTFRSVE
jgi:drug/metabolite transporter (DMT)-like permease